MAMFNECIVTASSFYSHMGLIHDILMNLLASSIIYATTILRIHPWQSILTFSLFINIYNDLYSSLQGATIKAEEGTGRILIARVMHGGAADRSGLISCGDEVIEVNGVNVEGKTPNDVLKILVRYHRTT